MVTKKGQKMIRELTDKDTSVGFSILALAFTKILTKFLPKLLITEQFGECTEHTGTVDHNLT